MKISSCFDVASQHFYALLVIAAPRGAAQRVVGRTTRSGQAIGPLRYLK